MWFKIVLILAIYAPYCYWILNLSHRWIYRNDDSRNESVSSSSFSIVIPFRNEGGRTISLARSLSAQLDDQTEVIFVNDHSSDGGDEKLEQFVALNENFSVLQSNGQGKKDALQRGIEFSTNDWVITLDADVSLSDLWFETVAKNLPDTDCVILPVTIDQDISLLQKFEVLDFLAMQSITFSYAERNRPFLANGAHLAFKKEAWQKVNGYDDHKEMASGDDVFLLESLVKNRCSISWLWNSELLVQTNAASGPGEFLHQRIRWGGKTSRFKSKDARILSYLIGAANLTLLALLCLGLFRLLLVALVVKTVVDLVFILPVLRKYQRNDLIKYLSMFILSYPFYITFVLVASVFIRPKWKGRQI